MTRVAKFLMAASAATMAVAPAMASPASKLSVAKSVRASAKTTKANELAGGGGVLIALAAGVAIIAAIIIVGSDEEDGIPDSA